MHRVSSAETQSVAHGMRSIPSPREAGRFAEATTWLTEYLVNAVAEVGVIGIPEPTAGEVVKAFVALKSGVEQSEALRKELLGHARQRLGPAIAPKEIAFRQNLPKTRSGKIMRWLLKARELGLPEGDISTLESEER
jgi:acyl-coenzyme A synthetase/AMP-(fatty) acid ligase